MNESILVDKFLTNLPDGLFFKNLSYKNDVFRGTLVVYKKAFPVVIGVKNTQSTALFREFSRKISVYAKRYELIPFITAQFFGERIRQVAKEEGVGIVDLAGNFYFKKNSILIERIVNKNPFSKKVPLINLFASVSSRITRVLLVNPKKTWFLNELSKEASVSLGQVHKVVGRMIDEEFLEWGLNKKLVLKNPTQLLKAWKSVYPLYKQQKFSFFSFEQDLSKVAETLIKKMKKDSFALSFFNGADLVAPFIRGVNKVQLYVKNIKDVKNLEELLKLQAVDNGANVEVYIPYDKGVFYKPQTASISKEVSVPIVSSVQLYMDLFNNPARGEEQAEHLRELKLGF